MYDSRARKEAGFTFAELAFAMLILVIGAAVLINHLAINYNTTSTERDRVFAYSKAQAILSEIQGFVDRGGVEAAVELDVLDDGVVNKNPLTIATDDLGNLVLPDHVLSGNYQRDGQWVWSRRISVQPFSGVVNRNVRYVTVRIYRRGTDGVERTMADLSAVINSSASAYPTTQVFDVYLLAIENIPGWWVYMDTMRPFVESMITDLESRNPGLEFRTHWITKASFGRNEGYRPYVNDAVDSNASIPDVYHYPGKMPAGEASIYYYVPDSIKAHINLDGADTNGYDADLNPHPYALADYFNHAMRYPDELELWQQRVKAITDREEEIAIAVAGGTAPPPEFTDMSKEPTLRLLLEGMYSDSDEYRNALVINLHGELLPMPALRNYSDAARTSSLPHVRCVTHPEELRTARDAASPGSSDSVVLRMYAYNDDTQTYTGPDRMSGSNFMTVEIMDMDLTEPGSTGLLKSSARLFNVPGGVPVAGNSDYSTTWLPATPWITSTNRAEEMWYYAYLSYSSDGHYMTRILLANTPVVCPLQTTAGPAQYCGLANTERAQLYQMPYVPSPVETLRNFSHDLTYPDASGPKNTARWKLYIDGVALTDDSFLDGAFHRYSPSGDVRLEVRTRIWSGSNPPNTGTMWPPASRNEPDNLSVTYTWWADSIEDVPITERAQFNGDPRHLPYKDCFNNDPDFPNAYNWYHNDLNDGSTFGVTDYAGIDPTRLRDRWNGAMCCDVPRYMELLRKGLAKSACVYTTLTGYSYYYLGIGNDIGYDSANGYPNSIPSNLQPHGTSGTGYLNTITGSRRLVRESGSNYWWGMPWLGELYPDTAVATWNVDSGGGMRGNLNPGTGSGQFYQSPAETVYAGSNRKAYGTVLQSHTQRTSTRGCITFFNTGSSGSTFDHIPTSGNGTLTSVGSELATNYNLDMPATTPVSRPFSLTDNATPAEEWNYAPYTTRSTTSMFRTYFTHASGIGSGVVKLVEPGSGSASYVVVNGIDKTVTSGTAFIAKWSMLTLAHTFFEAGDLSNTLRIKQQPRVEIEYPNDISELIDPASIDIQYDIDWTRWDGLPYTSTGSFTEDESELEYVIMYSRDGGRNWLHVQDGAAATPGERPTDSGHIESDLSIGAETYTWPVPSSTFPAGGYHLRIDCYRQGAKVHYAYHRTQIYIQR
ncbi:MAG: hypothetical protein KDC98_08550 [Planctomycetes bacterium]|nr:hypothetical protein [Planctomycetota bacterium]